MDNSSLLLDFSYEGKVEIRGEKLEMLMVLAKDLEAKHPSLEREDRLGQHPFAGFGTVMEDIKRTKVIASKLLSVYVVERYIGGGGQI